MEKNLNFLKLDKKLIFSDEKGNINPNLSMSFEISLKTNIKIDFNEILTYISKNSNEINNNKYSIYNKNEKNIIKITELNEEYALDTLLIEFFKKIEEKMKTEKICIKKLLIILDDLFSYEIKLIIQQAALINGFEIINIIDTNRALRFYIELCKTNQIFSNTKYVSIITKSNKNIQIAIYSYIPIKRLFNSFQDIPDIFVNLKTLKETKNGFILLDEYNENDLFNKIKEYIFNLIENEMGKQQFQNIEQIYIFEVENNPKLNEKIFLGVSKSLNSAITQECKAIFKRIDKNDNKENIYNGMTINKYYYYLNKNEIPILLDIELPFKGCFYTTIGLTLYQNMNNDNHVLIDVYFNQINYYYISLSTTSYCNSIEFMFYKTIPETIFNSVKYKNIKYEEKFEEKEIIKRLCLINVDRIDIKLNLIPEELKEGEDDEYKNITVTIGEKLNVLSFFKKNEFINRNLKSNICEYIKFFDNLNSNTTLDYIKLNQNELNNIYLKIKNSIINFDNIFKKRYSNLFNNSSFLLSYGKFEIFRTIFIENKNFGDKYNYNENNFNVFHNIIEQLEKFEEECKNSIKNDDLMVAKLYFTASIVFKNYLKLNKSTVLDKDLIGLIDFKKNGTIYNAAYENNIELISNLNKDSFLYQIFLQFYSGFKNKLTLQQIKLDLIRSLDIYGIRIFSDVKYFVDTNINTGITIYNEKNIFWEKLNEQKLLTSNDKNFKKKD